MNEPVQQHSDIIEQLQSKIQTLTDENRLLKQRMDEVCISYAESNGFTLRLHLLKVNYPMNDESTLCDAGCFF